MCHVVCRTFVAPFVFLHYALEGRVTVLLLHIFESYKNNIALLYYVERFFLHFTLSTKKFNEGACENNATFREFINKTYFKYARIIEIIEMVGGTTTNWLTG